MVLWGCGASPGTWDSPSLLGPAWGKGVLHTWLLEVSAQHRPRMCRRR